MPIEYTNPFTDMSTEGFFRQHILDGKQIAYTKDTVFEVQVGKLDSAYRTRYRITGNLPSAVLWYKGINIGPGHKKRLVCWTMNKPILARYIGR